MEFLSKNVEETAKIALDFASKLVPKHNKATIVGLYGELGSGKTTFMKYLAESFGIKETIKSPTFVIEKVYKLKSASKKVQNQKTFKLVPCNFQTLFHIDAYRIEKEEEMINLGWNEIIADPKNLICIEWADKIAGIMPSHIVITFEHVRENERKISIA